MRYHNIIMYLSEAVIMMCHTEEIIMINHVPNKCASPRQFLMMFSTRVREIGKCQSVRLYNK